ncbi:MAG: leucine-rich repeat protein [Ruminococcus sp.]
MIPDSVTQLGKWAFYDDSSSTDVTIGSGLTKLDNYQFYRSSLEDITIRTMSPAWATTPLPAVRTFPM